MSTPCNLTIVNGKGSSLRRYAWTALNNFPRVFLGGCPVGQSRRGGESPALLRGVGLPRRDQYLVRKLPIRHVRRIHYPPDMSRIAISVEVDRMENRRGGAA
jgi:hypothetical protein